MNEKKRKDRGRGIFEIFFSKLPRKIFAYENEPDKAKILQLKDDSIRVLAEGKGCHGEVPVPREKGN